MMQPSHAQAFLQNFLGGSPLWYKHTIIGFLLLNPIVFSFNPYAAGWLLLCEFLFTLVMSLRCYPLQPGGLLALQAVAIGMTSPGQVYHEVVRGFDVILLLIFMVAGVYFLKDLLLFIVTKLVLRVRSKVLLMLSFSSVTVMLSAFLDALTGIAIIITVAMGFYDVYHRAASARHRGAAGQAEGDPANRGDQAGPGQVDPGGAAARLVAMDQGGRSGTAREIDLRHDTGHDQSATRPEDASQALAILKATSIDWDLVELDDLEQFRAFLRSLVMHGAVATALGGVMTLVGEPQNLLIGSIAGWDFGEFFARMAPVSIPVVIVGLLTCVLLERFRLFGYGAELPESVRTVLEAYDQAENGRRNRRDTAVLITQAAVLVFLIAALALHLTAVGLVGVSVIILATACLGVVEERRLGHAFQEALPFTALLVVFFAVVAVIHDQHLLRPISDLVLEMPRQIQPAALYVVNGVLSTMTENVFIATVFINEVGDALAKGLIDREQFNLLAVAVNTGTNVPSVSTPNGQAAFLFLLTSALAPLIRLSYLRMTLMALPYSVAMTLTGFIAVAWFL